MSRRWIILLPSLCALLACAAMWGRLRHPHEGGLEAGRTHALLQQIEEDGLTGADWASFGHRPAPLAWALLAQIPRTPEAEGAWKACALAVVLAAAGALGARCAGGRGWAGLATAMVCLGAPPVVRTLHASSPVPLAAAAGAALWLLVTTSSEATRRRWLGPTAVVAAGLGSPVLALALGELVLEWLARRRGERASLWWLCGVAAGMVAAMAGAPGSPVGDWRPLGGSDPALWPVVSHTVAGLGVLGAAQLHLLPGMAVVGGDPARRVRALTIALAVTAVGWTTFHVSAWLPASIGASALFASFLSRGRLQLIGGGILAAPLLIAGPAALHAQSTRSETYAQASEILRRRIRSSPLRTPVRPFLVDEHVDGLRWLLDLGDGRPDLDVRPSPVNPFAFASIGRADGVFLTGGYLVVPRETGSASVGGLVLPAAMKLGDERYPPERITEALEVYLGNNLGLSRELVSEFEVAGQTWMPTRSGWQGWWPSLEAGEVKLGFAIWRVLPLRGFEPPLDGLEGVGEEQGAWWTLTEGHLGVPVFHGEGGDLVVRFRARGPESLSFHASAGGILADAAPDADGLVTLTFRRVPWGAVTIVVSAHGASGQDVGGGQVAVRDLVLQP